MAAFKAGIDNFKNYCILGDDIVIADDRVASYYLDIISNEMGVKINLNKSVISKNIAEFAKKIKGFNINFTPIGPGLILRTCRNIEYIGVLLNEAFKLELVDYHSLLGLIPSSPFGKKLPWDLIGLSL
jgi:hypothetical protein